MTAPRWVLDTNVVVSGLLSASGPPARLIDGAVSGALRLVYDDRIEAEYRDVLARPALKIDGAEREAFLAVLVLHECVTAPSWTGEALPDPDDQMFVEVALLADDHTLVTGNLWHFSRRNCAPVTVLDPRRPSWTC
jgi:putative PIN family toxin of toxin-antitoxin system